jgi:hypothetical protein
MATIVMQGPTIASCSLSTFVPLMIQENDHSTLDSKNALIGSSLINII